MAQVTIVYGHPYPRRSIGCRALVEAISTLEDVEVRPIYTLYPDFDIDVAAERTALERAQLERSLAAALIGNTGAKAACNLALHDLVGRQAGNVGQPGLAGRGDRRDDDGR